MTPSESAAASLSPSRSRRSPRRTFAPSADTAAAAVSDRARPVTSCPAAMSSGMMYEPEWPVPPVTKTRMLLLLLGDGAKEMAVRGRSAEAVTPRAKLKLPTPWRARPIISGPTPPAIAPSPGRRHPAAQSEALDEDRRVGFGLFLSGEEDVERPPSRQDVAEHGVERLTTCALPGRPWRSPAHRSAIRSDHPGGVSVEGVGDVDDHLAGQGIPVLGDDLNGAGVRDREDDDVAGGDGPQRPRRGPGAEGCSHPRLDRIRPMTSTSLPPATARAAMASAMPPRPMKLMLLMDECSLSRVGIELSAAEAQAPATADRLPGALEERHLSV